MCNISKQTFYKRRYKNGKYTHEKMSNIISHQENINKSHSETPLERLKLKTVNTKYQQSHGAEWNSYILDGNSKQYIYYFGKQFDKLSYKVKNTHTVRPSNPTSAYFPSNECSTQTFVSRMFTAAIFEIAQDWK